MPLALLLQDRLGVLTAGTKRIASLAATFEKAALVLRRRQGAFLAHWFGTESGLTIDGLDLRVGVVNSGALQARVGRIRSLQSRYADWFAGPNLLEPTAGMAGVLAGSLVTGLLAATISGSVMIGLLHLELSFFAKVATVFGGGVGMYLSYKDLMGAVGGETTNLLTGAEKGRSGAEWGEGLLGLATNPVAAAVGGLADRVATLVAQALGAAATFFQLIPVVQVLAKAKEPLLGLIEVGRTIAEAALLGTYDAIVQVVDATHLRDVPQLLLQGLRVALGQVLGLVGAGLRRITRPYKLLGTWLHDEWARIGRPVLDAVAKHPAVVFLRAIGRRWSELRGYAARVGAELKALFPLIGKAILPTSVAAVGAGAAAIYRKVSGWLGPSAPPTGPTWLDKQLAWLKSMAFPKGVPVAPTPPGRPALSTPLIGGDLVGKARREIGELPSVAAPKLAPRVFPAEAKALSAQLEQVAADPAYQAATKLLDVATALAGPIVAAEVAKLRSRLDEAELRIRDKRGPLPTPVKALPPERLLPKVARLRVTGTGTRTRSEVAAWVDDVVRRLRAEPVPVPVLSNSGLVVR